jgi:hypothetical protein
MPAAQPIKSRFATQLAAGACHWTSSMTETLSGFAALALLGFLVAFGLLMLFMALMQPIWCLVDCAIDGRRSTASKVVWIILLILLWSVANWFYGAFAAGNTILRRLTRLAWALAIALLIAFVAMFSMHGEFRREIKKEWRDYRGIVVRESPPRGPGPAA